MRIAVLGGWVLATLLLATFAAAIVPSVSMAQRPASSPVGGVSGIIALTQAGEKHQQLTVIDPETRVMSVYHVDLASGEIALKSVRNIHWDLQMIEFNSNSPLPQEIRSLLGKK